MLNSGIYDEMMGKIGKKVAVIGGGAAGCFAAVNMKEMNPDLDVTVYEAGPELLPIRLPRSAASNPSIHEGSV